MSIIGTFPTTIANGQVEDATVVMSLFAWIQAQTNGNACAATTGSAMLKGDGAGNTAIAISGTDYAPGTQALATGVLKSTTTTGALTIASLSDFTSLGLAASGEIGSFSGAFGYNASQTLLASQIGMQLLFYGSTAGQTFTLPLRSTTTTGNAFWFVNVATVPFTVAVTGSDALGINTPGQAYATVASVVLQPGDSTCFVNDGSSLWLEQQGVRAVNSPLIRAIGPAGYSATGTIALSDLNRPIVSYPAVPITTTLPTGTAAGQSISITNNSPTAGAFITLAGAGSQMIYSQGVSGRASVVLGLGDSVTLVFDGSNWFQVSGAAQFGIGQTILTGTTSTSTPVSGSTYTNITGKTIYVWVTSPVNALSASTYQFSVNTGGGMVVVDSKVVGQSGSGVTSQMTVGGPVPPGASYMANVAGGVSVWKELR